MLAHREAAEHVERIDGAVAALRRRTHGLDAADLLAIDEDDELCAAVPLILGDPQPQRVGPAADRAQGDIGPRRRRWRSAHRRGVVDREEARAAIEHGQQWRGSADRDAVVARAFHIQVAVIGQRAIPAIIEEGDADRMLAHREAAEHVERIDGAVAALRRRTHGLDAADLLAIDADDELCAAVPLILGDAQLQHIRAAADRRQRNIDCRARLPCRDVQPAELVGEDVDVVHEAVRPLDEVDRPAVRAVEELQLGAIKRVDRVDFPVGEILEEEIILQLRRIGVARVDRGTAGDRRNSEAGGGRIVREGTERRRDDDAAIGHRGVERRGLDEVLVVGGPLQNAAISAFEKWPAEIGTAAARLDHLPGEPAGIGQKQPAFAVKGAREGIT